MKKKEIKKAKISSKNVLRIKNEIQSIKKKIAEMKSDIINGKKIDPVKFLKLEKRVGSVEKEFANYRLER